MALLDQILAANEHYATTKHVGPRPLAPARHLAVVACMDSRLDVFGVLGLANNDAHVIRNAGGIVTDDVIRSLLLSQRLMGTTDVVLVHHTDCGMQKVSDDQLKRELEAEIGVRPAFAIEAFDDPEANVRQSIARLLASPFLRHDGSIIGFVYDVATGRLNLVEVRSALD